jgi:hypothetical protein
LRITMTDTDSRATAYSSNGTYGTNYDGTPATFTMTGYAAGIDYLNASLITAPTYGSLQAAFNNNGITASGAVGNIDLTTANASIDATKIPATVTVGGIDFTRPAEQANGQDNVIALGQKITIPSQKVKSVHLLAASTCGTTALSPNNRLTLNYAPTADGTQLDPANLSLPAVTNWTSSVTDTANAYAISAGGKTGTTANSTTPVVYKITANQEDSDFHQANVTSITLPNSNIPTITGNCRQPGLHILAMTIEAP